MKSSKQKFRNLNDTDSGFLWGGEDRSLSPPVNTLSSFLRTRWFMLRDSAKWFKPEGVSSSSQIFNEWFGLLGYPYDALMPALRLHLRPDMRNLTINDSLEFENFSNIFFRDWAFPKNVTFYLNDKLHSVEPLNIFEQFFCTSMNGIDIKIIGKISGLPKSYMSYIPEELTEYYTVIINGTSGILGLDTLFENPLGFSGFKTGVFFNVNSDEPYKPITDFPEINCIIPVQIFKSQKNIKDFFEI